MRETNLKTIPDDLKRKIKSGLKQATKRLNKVA